MKIGFLGPVGTFTEEAASSLLAEALVPLETIEAVFEAVQAGVVDQGVVPIENIIQGPVTETLDALYAHSSDLTIADIVLLDIELTLGALAGERDIRMILSKDQALQQCSKFLRASFPDAELVEMTSTSAAMKKVANERISGAAVVGSEAAIRKYGLEVRARDIGNVKGNKTRFAVIRRREFGVHPRTGNDVTALVITPKLDRVGFLAEVLELISKRHSVNCQSIYSRPDGQGALRFFLVLEGHAADEQIRRCLEALEGHLADQRVEVKILGSHPSGPFSSPLLKTVGILGGEGRMGKWFSDFFGTAGIEVLSVDLHTALTFEECVKRSDVILLSVPIRETLRMIERVAPLLRPGQLLVDNTSVKSGAVEEMLKGVQPGVEVLGLHTIFGPSVGHLDGQHVVLTRTAASGPLAGEMEALFFKYGATIVRATPNHHDRQMAFHQNLEHFVKIVMAEVIRREFPDLEEFEKFSSPNSRATLATLARILRGTPDVLTEIQQFNRLGPQMIGTFLETAKAIGDDLIAGRVGNFRESLAASIAAFGPERLQRYVDGTFK